MSGLIPGVTNRDARAVYDARIESLRQARDDGDEAELGRGLAEAVYLKLWRARAVAGFDALAAGVLELDPARARELAKQAGGEDLNPLTDLVAALWLRSEATLLALCPSGRVHVKLGPEGPEFRVAVPLQDPLRALEALAEIGRRLSSLRKLL